MRPRTIKADDPPKMQDEVIREFPHWAYFTLKNGPFSGWPDMYSTLIMVVSRGLNFPSRFWAKFEYFPGKMRDFLPSIFYFVTAFVINPINDVFFIRYKSGPICCSITLDP